MLEDLNEAPEMISEGYIHRNLLFFIRILPVVQNKPFNSCEAF